MEKIKAGIGSSFSYESRLWKQIKNGFTHFANGDVAFAKITPCFQNLKSAIFDNLPNGIGSGTTELKVLRSINNTVEQGYLLIFLQSPYFINEAKFKGTANQQRIISGYLEEKLFPLPSINEQQKIVRTFDSLIPKLQEYEEIFTQFTQLNVNVKEALKKSLLQDAIQGRLVPQIESEGTAEDLLEEIRNEKKRLVKEGKLKKLAIVNESRIFRGDDNKYYEQIGSKILEIEVPYDIPDSWSWIRLGELALLNMGKTPSRGEQQYWSNGIYPWVSISDMVEGGNITITKELVSESAAINVFKTTPSPKGSLLMSFKLTIGKISILEIDAYHNEAIVTIISYIESELIKQFLMRFLPILSQQGDSKDAIKGKTLNSKSLFNLLIPLPPLREIDRILQKVKDVTAKM